MCHSIVASSEVVLGVPDYGTEKILYCRFIRSCVGGSRLWRRKKLVLSIHQKFCWGFPIMAPKKACIVASSEVAVGVPDYGAGNIPGWKFPHRKKTCALPWRFFFLWVVVRMHDALGLHGALGVHGAWGLMVGARPFYKLQNVPWGMGYEKC